MFPKYLLIAYKPHSNDYACGNHVASYDSEFVLVEADTPQPIIDKMAECLATELDSNEAGFETRVYAPSEDEAAQIQAHAEQMANQLIADRQYAKARKAEQDKINREAAAQDARRRQFEQLKAEFEPSTVTP